MRWCEVPEVGVPYDVVAAGRVAAELFTTGSDHWSHARATARRAAEIAPMVCGLDQDVLVCAAWLHDVGFCAPAVDTGFHPLDGARWLAAAGWPEPVVGLVAHHCEARLTAEALGLGSELQAFRRDEGPTTDALVYADLATGPDGRRTSLRDRLAAMDARHVDDTPVLAEAWVRRRAALIAATSRTEQRMAGAHRLRARPA